MKIFEENNFYGFKGKKGRKEERKIYYIFEKLIGFHYILILRENITKIIFKKYGLFFSKLENFN